MTHIHKACKKIIIQYRLLCIPWLHRKLALAGSSSVQFIQFSLMGGEIVNQHFVMSGRLVLVVNAGFDLRMYFLGVKR